MNKVILMSVQPKWLAKILNGDKTIDIRKTIPKCELPIDVYLYCTKGKKYLHHDYMFLTDNDRLFLSGKIELPSGFILNGKVVAKFTLKRCDKRSIAGLTHSLSDFNTFLKRTGIDWYRNSKEFHDYVGEKDYIYAWHIDNLVIFGKPKKLSEFYKKVEFLWGDTGYCNKGGEPIEYHPIEKAPRGWRYAYVRNDE